MNKYWSNEDDKKVSYVAEQPPRRVRAGDGEGAVSRTSAPRQADGEPAAPYAPRREQGRRAEGERFLEEAEPRRTYGPDRSTFLSGEPDGDRRPDTQFAPPPKFARQADDPSVWRPQEPAAYAEGYQVRSEQKRGGRGFLIFLIVVLVLLLIGGGAYIFRYQILDLVGQVFGQEAVWKIMPTPAPTAAVTDAPAYVEAAKPDVKTRTQQEIQAVTGDLPLETYAVTGSSVLLRSPNADGTADYYLFAADTGRLQGYYEKLRELVTCSDDVFYISESPYLITSGGYPLVDPASFTRSAGGAVEIKPMINGWAIVAGVDGQKYNYVGADGALISDLWFAKAFPFTFDTTLAYVDTGNLTDPASRYALYLLRTDGVTKRLSFAPDMNGVVESLCGMAFMQNGEVRAQTEELPLVANTDDAAAYVNCGALVVRDAETKLYGLFVDGVQQYPFAFDSIEPMRSDLTWEEAADGYVRRYAVANQAYPLPRSYSFVLKQGDTVQIVSIAAASEYPAVFD